MNSENLEDLKNSFKEISKFFPLSFINSDLGGYVSALIKKNQEIRERRLKLKNRLLQFYPEEEIEELMDSRSIRDLEWLLTLKEFDRDVKHNLESLQKSFEDAGKQLIITALNAIDYEKLELGFSQPKVFLKRSEHKKRSAHGKKPTFATRNQNSYLKTKNRY